MKEIGLQKSITFGVIILVTVASIFGAVNVAHHTVDDSALLPELLGQNRPAVLGANNLNDINENGCPKSKPVAGWINFRGRKVITDTFPQGQTASACFENTKEANDNGYSL